MPELPGKDAKSDFHYIDRAEVDQIADALVDMVETRIPTKFRHDPILVGADGNGA
jgi:hypothetical protein